MKDKKVHKILTCKTSIKSMKYINRDINSVKNMKKIVMSYIEKNEKPLPFIKGIKICFKYNLSTSKNKLLIIYFYL